MTQEHPSPEDFGETYEIFQRYVELDGRLKRLKWFFILIFVSLTLLFLFLSIEVASSIRVGATLSSMFDLTYSSQEGSEWRSDALKIANDGIDDIAGRVGKQWPDISKSFRVEYENFRNESLSNTKESMKELRLHLARDGYPDSLGRLGKSIGVGDRQEMESIYDTYRIALPSVVEEDLNADLLITKRAVDFIRNDLESYEPAHERGKSVEALAKELEASFSAYVDYYSDSAEERALDR